MKKNMKRVICLLLAGLMVFAFTGCGKKKQPVVSLTTQATTTAITTAETTTEETTTEETTTEETTEETTTEATTTEATTTTEEETTTTKKKVVKKATPTMNPKNIKLTAYKATVYAKNKMNVRSGPGTNYKIVKTLEKGDGIDVRYKTNNGWYKTINGNYVLASLTVKTKPA